MSYFNDHSNYQRRKHVWNFYTVPFWGSQTNPKWPFPPKNPISFLKLSIKKNKITAQLPLAKANHLYLSSLVFLTKKKISQKHFSATSPCLKKIFLERLWKGFAYYWVIKNEALHKLALLFFPRKFFIRDWNQWEKQHKNREFSEFIW